MITTGIICTDTNSNGYIEMSTYLVNVDRTGFVTGAMWAMVAGGDEIGAYNVLWGAGAAERGAQSRHSGRPHRHFCAHAGQRRLQHPAGPTAAAAGAERCSVRPYCHRPWRQAGKHNVSTCCAAVEHHKVGLREQLCMPLGCHNRCLCFVTHVTQTHVRHMSGCRA